MATVGVRGGLSPNHVRREEGCLERSDRGLDRAAEHERERRPLSSPRARRRGLIDSQSMTATRSRTSMPPTDEQQHAPRRRAFSARLVLRPDREQVRAVPASAFIEHRADLWPAGEQGAIDDWIDATACSRRIERQRCARRWRPGSSIAWRGCPSCYSASISRCRSTVDAEPPQTASARRAAVLLRKRDTYTI
jgi:hypothetical protein